jgi:hypothetical protein
MNKNSKKTS